MPHDRLALSLDDHLQTLDQSGTRKGHERIISAVIPAAETRRSSYLIEGQGERQFLCMNANKYLGLCRLMQRPLKLRLAPTVPDPARCASFPAHEKPIPISRRVLLPFMAASQQ